MIEFPFVIPGVEPNIRSLGYYQNNYENSAAFIIVIILKHETKISILNFLSFRSNYLYRI